MAAPSCFRSVLLAPALALGVSALTACGGSTASADLPSTPYPLDSDENDLLLAFNNLRMSLSLPAANQCYTLDVSASGHSDDLRDNPAIPLGMAGSGTDNATVKMRACAAGYKPACLGSAALGEVVASGYSDGAAVLDGWASDATAGPIIKSAGFIVVGVGRSQGATEYIWTMDLASITSSTCTAP